MTRPLHEWERVQQLIREGLNNCQISRTTGIPLSTVWRWRVEPKRALSLPSRGCCPRCDARVLDVGAYAYLLGLYLGDGWIGAKTERDVWRLEISLDRRYPDIVEECRRAMGLVRWGNRREAAARLTKSNCWIVYAYWKHWPCLFPQVGPGHKHERRIELCDWQTDVLRAHPELLLRGLIHSDGSRDLNPVNGKNYARYQFSNVSEDIRGIFCAACDYLGVRWRKAEKKTVSVARRRDVAILDRLIGPKR